MMARLCLVELLPAGTRDGKQWDSGGAAERHHNASLLQWAKATVQWCCHQAALVIVGSLCFSLLRPPVPFAEYCLLLIWSCVASERISS